MKTLIDGVQKEPAFKVVKPEDSGLDAPVMMYVSIDGSTSWHDMSQFVDNPRFISANRSVVDAKSFIAYYNRFNIPETLVIASPKGKYVMAQFDYGTRETARASKHTLRLELQRSDDYVKWLTAGLEPMGRSLMSQEKFADFIDDMKHTVVEPSSAEMVDLAQSLILHTEQVMGGPINRSNGSFNLSFSENTTTHSKAGVVIVPEKIIICLAPWYGSKPRDIIVNLKVRKGESGPMFGVTIDQQDKMEADAFNEILDTLKAESIEPLLIA